MTDWDDNDPSAVKSASVKQNKTVVLKHMFTLQELEEDPALILDLKEEIREECEKLGEVSNVILYDLEEDGVVIVRFKDVEAANQCVSVCQSGLAFYRAVLILHTAYERAFLWRSTSGSDGHGWQSEVQEDECQDYD